MVPDDRQAREHRKSMKSEHEDYISTPYVKDAAFYVDISPAGEVLSPSRVDRFAGVEIAGLEWYLDQARSLKTVLSDDQKWKWFSGRVHSCIA